ncbi:MAG: S-layer family protein [Calothrix sp. FI2-JRJ7]|nr:S-layer family protein [Calothrix sp. FI2-JRJ7]
MNWKLGLTVWLAISAVSASSRDCTLAQITPDSTLGNESSKVTPPDPNSPVDVIYGGAQRGANLFHSFREFNVGEGRGAYFYSGSADIQNILARVTGSNRSEILGTLGTYGDSNPNLFLINPNGIIFGLKASLDMGNAGLNNPRPGGSFVATTANAVLLGDKGIFSASDPTASNLLTVNPSALFFNNASKSEIVNQSRAETSILGYSINGLQVPNGRSVLLVGGDVNLDGGKITALGGRVELGGVAASGAVGLNIDGNNLSLSYAQGVQRGDVLLTNEATADVAAGNGGSIAVNTQNFNISGQSTLRAGIWSELGSIGSQAGDITLDATGAVEINDSSISNYVATEAVGNGGDITIKARSLDLSNEAQVVTITYGTGDAGRVFVQAEDSVSLAGYSTAIISNVMSFGTTTSDDSPLAKGNSGGISIKASSLSLTDGAQLVSSTFGQGSAGSILVQVDDSVSLADAIIISTVGFITRSRAVGNSGGIRLQAKSLSLTDGAQLITSTFGQGNAGSIFVQVNDSISLVGSPAVSILPTEPRLIPGHDYFFSFPGNLGLGNASTGIYSTVESEAKGNAGDIDIQSRSLSLTEEGAEVQSLTRGEGKAGDIRVNVSNSVDLSGVFSQELDLGDVILGGFSSGLISATEGEASGPGGNIELTTNTLRLSHGAVLNARTRNATSGGNITVKTNSVELTGGGQILTSAFSSGNAGNITVNTTDRVSISGSDPTFPARLEQFGEATVDPDGPNSGLFATVRGNATANAGKIEVNAGSIRLDKQGTITTETTLGEGGNITLNVKDILLLRNNSSITATAGTAQQGGNGGNININTPSGFIVAESRENSDITANAYTGKGGNVLINAFGVYGTQYREKENPQTNDITASSRFGFNGTVQINTPNIDFNRGLINLPVVPVDTEVAQGCSAGGSQAQSKFMVTGRGGLPPNPGETLSTDTVEVDLVILEREAQRSTTAVSTSSTSSTRPAIVEATGWVKNARGEVVLIATPSTATPDSSWQKTVQCRAR